MKVSPITKRKKKVFLEESKCILKYIILLFNYVSTNAYFDHIVKRIM